MEERSAGSVVFRDGGARGRLFLLLFNAGRWDFPKGNREEGESELQTAVRETREETGLGELVMLPGFRKVIEYFYRRDGRNVHKQVVYHLARATSGDVRISSEHQGFGWFAFDQAVAHASYEKSKKLLADAERFLSEGAPGPGALRTGREGESRQA